MNPLKTQYAVWDGHAFLGEHILGGLMRMSTPLDTPNVSVIFDTLKEAEMHYSRASYPPYFRVVEIVTCVKEIEDESDG